MPRYFFHISDGKDLPDEDGTELPDLAHAREQAVIAAGEAIRDAGSRFWNHGEWGMQVVDERGEPVCTLRFVGR